MYVILPVATEKAFKKHSLLHRVQTVTVLYLDKKRRLWQYIVEVFKK